jgi:hypothetical protein
LFKAQLKDYHDYLRQDEISAFSLITLQSEVFTDNSTVYFLSMTVTNDELYDKGLRYFLQVLIEIYSDGVRVGLVGWLCKNANAQSRRRS